MLRMKKLKKTKKMRGGLLGPESSKQLAQATNSYGQWWDKTKAGAMRAEKETNIAIGDFKHHHGKTRQSFAGSPPKQATHSDLAIRAMENLSIENQGSHAPLVARQHQEAIVGDQSTANTNPFLEPVHRGNAPRTGRHAPRSFTLTGGKRKTKKRRRKRKKKKTKRKKRRKKRKTKRRKRRR